MYLDGAGTSLVPRAPGIGHVIACNAVQVLRGPAPGSTSPPISSPRPNELLVTLTAPAEAADHADPSAPQAPTSSMVRRAEKRGHPKRPTLGNTPPVRRLTIEATYSIKPDCSGG